MQKLLNKIIAVIVIAMIASIDVIPAVTYAADTEQNSKTTEENVEFNATINNAYDATLDIDEGGSLDLNIKVSGTGYLKDIKIAFENNNYQVANTGDENIKSIHDNIIELEEVNTGKMLNLSFPIKLTMQDKIAKDILGRDSKITLNAIYVNKNGKERKIEKTITEHVEWNATLNELISQELIRYIKFDENKTIVSFKILEGLENNKLPIENKEITIKVPSLENTKPSKVIVTGEGISYKYEDDIVTINKSNSQNEDGNINWNSQDEFIITYIYDTQVESTTIDAEVTSKVNVKGNIIEGQLQNYSYDLKEKVGEYVEVETLGTSDVSKGYMYTNLKNGEATLETPFDITLRANVGYKELTDKIKIVETEELFNSLDASNSIINKKVKVQKDNLAQILGENGTIKILDEAGTELGIINKDNLEIELNTRKIIIETSKIENEGNLDIIISKAINSNNTYNKKQISEFTELFLSGNIQSIKNDEINSSKIVNRTISMSEPSSNASLEVNMRNLSTVVKNENVILTATLKTDDIADALYSNAKLSITLPEAVKEINIKEAGLIYEDELKLENVAVKGNVISFELNGTQTKYSSQATANGTVVRFVTDITLDNLAPNSSSTVKLTYTNEDTGETNEKQVNIQIIAPTGFVTTNSLELEGEKITAQEGSEKIAKIEVNESAKNATISGTIVNNLGREATGVTIVGTIPSSGNLDANGVELGSNFDTSLAKAVNVKGIDAQILYSNNANETINGDSWTSEFSKTAKAYKIVANGPVETISTMTFDYEVEVPENLQYDKTAKSTYAVYYNNDAETGIAQNYVLAKAVGITTGEIPAINLSSSLTDVNTNANINNVIKGGELVKYKLDISNTGKEVANNITVTITLPEEIRLANEVYEMTDYPRYTYNMETNTITETIDSLNPGETKTIEKNLMAKLKFSQDKLLQTISAQVTADKIEQPVTIENEVEIIDGDLEILASSNRNDKSLTIGQPVKYYLEIKNTNGTGLYNGPETDSSKKTNIQIVTKLPKEFKFISAKCSDDVKYNYDERSNTITFTKPELKSQWIDSILMFLEVKEFSNNNRVSVDTKYTCDNMEEKTVKSLNYNLVKDIMTVRQTSSIPEGDMGDKDGLEYYIDVTNNSNETKTVTVRDEVPAELNVYGYEVQDSKGTREEKNKSQNIFDTLEINAGETARLTIITKPFPLQKGRNIKVENKAEVESQDISLTTNSLKHTIMGTSEHSTGPSVNPQGDINDDDDITTKEGTYKVSGIAWIDGNSNGRKDTSEERVAGLNAKLYSKETGKVALDVDGKELVTATDVSGKYTFINVVPGSYIVVVEIEGLNYGVAPYKLADVSESENSDFVTTKINNKEVAATDEIKIENANIYNIDLGLVRSKIFDLDINKTVTRITVTNTKSETKTYDQNYLSVAKVELATKNVEYATVLIEYTLRIENKGQVSGYAKSIVDYIPEGMTFNSELNNSWYLGKDGNAYNTSLANTLINPGETKDIKLILSRKMSDENMGTVRNQAEILMTYNEYGLEDLDTLSGNQDKTSDKSAADVVIGTSTGKEIASFVGIALGILAILAISVFEIKKHIINKMYNFVERS